MYRFQIARNVGETVLIIYLTISSCTSMNPTFCIYVFDECHGFQKNIEPSIKGH